MKQVFSIFFAGWFLLGGLIPLGDYSQLMKMPDLMEHYRLHQAEASASGEKSTFFQFIDEHYFSPRNHQHQGENDHPDLPMYHISIGMQYVFETQIKDAFQWQIEVEESIHETHLSLYSSEYVQIKDRPPIVA